MADKNKPKPAAAKSENSVRRNGKAFKKNPRRSKRFEDHTPARQARLRELEEQRKHRAVLNKEQRELQRAWRERENARLAEEKRLAEEAAVQAVLDREGRRARAKEAAHARRRDAKAADRLRKIGQAAVAPKAREPKSDGAFMLSIES